MNGKCTPILLLAFMCIVVLIAILTAPTVRGEPSVNHAGATSVTPPRVPGSPTRLTITRYAGLNAPRPDAATHSATIDNAATVQSLAREINRLPLVTGVVHCPMDDGSHLKLVFRDANGTAHHVRVGLRGCQSVTAPHAPPGRLADDTHVLPRIMKLLDGPRGHALS
jgi:hypothetical protein